MPVMAEFYQNQTRVDNYLSLSFDEHLELLIDAEHDYRDRNKIAWLIKQAKLSEANAQLEETHYFPNRKLNKEDFLQLASNLCIERPRNVILTGMPDLLAGPILDRVLPRAKFIHIDGDKSMRSR